MYNFFTSAHVMKFLITSTFIMKFIYNFLFYDEKMQSKQQKIRAILFQSRSNKIVFILFLRS